VYCCYGISLMYSSLSSLCQYDSHVWSSYMRNVRVVVAESIGSEAVAEGVLDVVGLGRFDRSAVVENHDDLNCHWSRQSSGTSIQLDNCTVGITAPMRLYDDGYPRQPGDSFNCPETTDCHPVT